MAHGFAAIKYTGELLVLTVSETERGAMVNWLMAIDGSPVFRGDTDEWIKRRFTERAIYRGMATIEPVLITIDRSGRA